MPRCFVARTRDVAGKAYLTYFSAAGWVYILGWLLSAICARCCEIAMPFVLSLWSDFNVAACEDQELAAGRNVTFGSIDVTDCVLPAELRWVAPDERWTEAKPPQLVKPLCRIRCSKC